ncbi:MAG TPA: helix-hairpin-helix domain-containing protein [Actinoplanes sp.]|nr:helix-hairpin-helix domain-containing protein [Actinoplanes sp.]
MASFLYLVLGVVIGLLGGWFLRGLRAGSATPTESTPTESTPTESSTTEVAATEPEPVAAEAEPVAATEPVAEPAAAAEPEPAAPAAEPELVTATATPEPAVAAPVVAEPVIVEPVITESPAADPAVAGEPAAISQVDNLTKIAGVGPKAAAALTTAGITTYRQLADSDEAAIRAALAAAGMRATAAVAAWPERAKQLVDSGN